MGYKFTISVWKDEWNHVQNKPEWGYHEVWGGDDFDEALKELEKYRGKYGCVKLECRE